ncbi:MAG: serine/threonine protein kinase [Deltaproteobacteria bacterium]|nr:serine/threonine protein kinase [Deltaproteobacteria bacterium]
MAMIGQVVGTYHILSQLGAGGMGAVWLAEHTLLGRRVAIKFLLPEVSQNQAIVNRFFAEARAATRIADPGIVVVYDFGWHTDGAAYIVMEHLAGQSVQARLRDGRFAVADAVRVVRQTAMAMAVAHATGIIHRDLKPDNLFLVPDPAVAGGERIKILDFGIAKLLGDEHGNPSRTRTGVIMGTPTYMSPEQCRGAGDVDHRTDIYALGCVLFHLLCGRLPFTASTPGDMIAAHLRETPPLPSMFVPQIPLTIDTITMKCLAKRADDRYASMTELARDLAAAIGSLSEIPSIAPVRALPRGTSSPAPPPPPAITEPPIVPPTAPTVAGSGSAAQYPHGPLSTFASSAGESVSRTRRGGRLLGAVLAVLAAGAIVVAMVVASGSTSAPAGGSEHGTTTPAMPRDAALIDDARAEVPADGSAHGIAGTLDAGGPAKRAPDAPKKLRPRGSDDDPFDHP